MDGFRAECWHNLVVVGALIPDGLVLALELLDTTETLSGMSLSATASALISLMVPSCHWSLDKAHSHTLIWETHTQTIHRKAPKFIYMGWWCGVITNPQVWPSYTRRKTSNFSALDHDSFTCTSPIDTRSVVCTRHRHCHKDTRANIAFSRMLTGIGIYPLTALSRHLGI